VFKAIGASNFTVMRQFMVEAVTFTLAASAIGLILGVVGGNPVTRLLVNNSSSTPAAAGAGQGGANIPRLGGAGGGAGFRGGGAGLARLANPQRLNLANIHVAVGWSVLSYGLGGALLIALAGSAIPSLLMARVRPAEVLRTD
jgi:putative ABC transport system permease protein